MGTILGSNARVRRMVALWAMLVTGGLVTLAIDRIVRATPGGQTKEMLSFVGTLRQNGQPLMGQQTLTFAFKKGGNQICAPQVMVTPDASSGAFTAQIDISTCPSTLFDGGDVVFDVSVGNNVIAAAQPINAMPYAKYADRYGSPDCPVGYVRDVTAMGIVLCKNGADEVVKVGTGPMAFWIDRYEASLWQNADGTGMQFGLQMDDAHTFGFVHNGQWTKPVFAVSKTGVMPAAANLTWYQMSEGCRLAGKHLPRNSEWIAAARGTPDPGGSNGANGVCLTQSNAPRPTGMGTNCMSAWGAQDMIGNLNEWVDDWLISGMNAASLPNEFNADFQTPFQTLARGGSWQDGAGAGVFYAEVGNTPEGPSAVTVGFRCMMSR